MINYIKKTKKWGIMMSKRARKIFAWCMLIAMIASVAATVISYAIYS